MPLSFSEKITDIYNKELLPHLIPMEQERKSILKKLSLYTIVFSSLSLLCFTISIAIFLNGNFLFFDKSEVSFTIFFFGITMILTMLWIIKSTVSQFTYSFKNKVIKQIINSVHPGLKYNPTSHIRLKHFKEADLFNCYVDDFDGDDLVEGMIGSTQIQFSELHVKTRLTDEEESVLYHFRKRVFDGLFFRADFNKHINGEVFVFPDKTEKHFGRFVHKFQKLSSLWGQLIKMDSPIFEQYFKVYASDKIQAHYILTPRLMKGLVDFRQKANRDICISFRGECIYLAIPYKKTLFEPRLFKKMDEFSSVWEYFHDIFLALSIVNELNLNTRIWTKE